MISIIKAEIAGIAGVMVSVLFGKVDGLLITLVFVMVIDYFTAILSAIASKSLSSETGYIGLCRKMGCLLILILAARLDIMIGAHTYYLRYSVCIFYILNDAISILENLSKFMKIPESLQKFLKQYQDSLKNNNKKGEKHDE